MRHTAQDWLSLAALVGMWGSSYLSIKFALESYGPLSIVGGRLVLGVAILAAVAWWMRPRLPDTREQWIWMLVLAVVGNCLPFFLITWGQQHIDASLGGILVAVMPLGVLVLAHLFVASERLTPPRAVGFLFGFAGVVVLIGPDALYSLGGQGAGGLHLYGQLAVLGGALCYSANAVIARRMPPVDSIAVAACTLAIAGVVMAPLALWVEDPMQTIPTTNAALAMLWMGIFTTGFATIVYFSLIRRAGATFMSLTNYLAPAIAVALGMLVLGERPKASSFAGMLLILAGIGIAQIRGWWPRRA